MEESFNIAELVCTRLSHDLIGNIGAVSNAVELLDDDPSSIEDIKPILEISSKTLTARLKFFRLAFGLSNAAPKNLSEIKEISEAYLKTIGAKGTQIDIQWNVQSPELYKILMLSIMMLADLFIKSGTIRIDENTLGLSFAAHTDHVFSENKVKALQECLNGTFPAENPAQYAPVLYLQNILEKASVQMSFSAEPNHIDFKIA